MAIKPECLSMGDTIALVSPANNLSERFEKQEEYSIAYLEKLGYKVKNYINHKDVTNPVVRANTLLEAYADIDVKAILPICGGEKVYEIINLLDYSFISQHPKIICGYSFMASLLLAITEYANCNTFIGPHINFINDKSTNRELLYTVSAFWSVLSWADVEKTGLSNYERAFLPKRLSDRTLELSNVYRNSDKLKQSRRDISYIALNNVSTKESIVVAQSLDGLVFMDKYDISLNFNNKLLLLDTLDNSFEDIKVKLKTLNTKYSFNNLSGIVFSSFNERSDKNTYQLDLQNKTKIRNFLNDIYDLFGISNLYYGFPMGHCKYKLTVPIGIKAIFNSISGNLVYTESPFVKQR